MFVGDRKARLDIDEGCHDGARGNLKTWIDDDVDIGAIVVADESIMPISYVETSAHIVEGEELRTHSGVDVYLASETDFCQGCKMWSG